MLSSADRQTVEQAALAQLVSARVATLWRRVTASTVADTWRALSTDVLRVVVAGQLAAARTAVGYVDAALAEQGAADAGAGTLILSAFAGAAADGRPLDSLLDWPVTGRGGVLDRVAQGVQPTEALTEGGYRLQVLAATTVQDAGRAAVGVDIVQHQRIGYVRTLTPPSCARCVILAGRWYAWNTGFERHPLCLPAGVVVSGPATLAATRRWYQGELVVLRTASGKHLAATGNHPVLTAGGWLPANLVQEGDHVVGGSSGERAHPLVVPHEHQVPALVEQVWRAGRVAGLVRVPAAPEDFHGDGGHGQVDVVRADCALRLGDDSPLHQAVVHEQFARGIAQALELVGRRDLRLDGFWPRSAADGIVRGRRLGASLVGCHAPGAQPAGAGSASWLDAGFHQAAADGVPADPESAADAVFTLAGPVAQDDGVLGQRGDGPRWDPPPGPFTLESRAAHTSRGRDLLKRLAGQVAPDRVVGVSRVEWSGHVYNLTSAEGWYSANGLIVSNCDCRHVPTLEADAEDLATDPHVYARSLTPGEQDELLTKAGGQAFRDGADLNQLVNARRGLTQGGLTTTEGTTRRGFAGSRLRGRQRMTPELIYRLASDRAEAISLLRSNGYITT